MWRKDSTKFCLRKGYLYFFPGVLPLILAYLGLGTGDLFMEKFKFRVWIIKGVLKDGNVPGTHMIAIIYPIWLSGSGRSSIIQLAAKN
jgi:hypothetical protein